MTRLNKKTLRRIKAEANHIRKIYESPNPEVDSIMENLRLERERFNEGVIGVCEKCGKEITEIPCNAEKSTFPIKIATIYPTTSPNRTDSCFR